MGSLVPLQMLGGQTAPVPVPSFVISASDFTVIADQENKHVERSTEDNFTAHGSASNPLDHSSVSGAQSISYGGGTFTGSGRLEVIAGRLDGTNSIAATGETSVYIFFETTNAFHYHLVATIETTKGLSAYVIFNGLNISNGTVTANGTIRADRYELQAYMGQRASDDDGKGSWSYSLSLTPTSVNPGRYSAPQKADFYAQMSALQSLGDQLANQAYKVRSAMRGELLAGSASLLALADGLGWDFLDPLDTNYAVIPQAAVPPVTPLAPGDGITQVAADDWNAWLTNLSQSVGYGVALTTCLNRAQGAAFAGSSYWDTAQMTAAVQFEAQLAALLDQEPALRSMVVAQFQSDGFQSTTVTPDDIIALQSQIATNGLPADLLDALRNLGAAAATITNIQNGLIVADPDNLAGSFPGILVNTNLDSAAHNLAAGLRDASLRLINVGSLPGGQCRFDLPTQPGHTYTIQFSQNLANPGNWTTLFTNQATTALMSFTNMLPLNAPAGFYRASHN